MLSIPSRVGMVSTGSARYNCCSRQGNTTFSNMLKVLLKTHRFFGNFFDLTNVFKSNEISNIFRNIDISPFTFRLKTDEFI